MKIGVWVLLLTKHSEPQQSSFLGIVQGLLFLYVCSSLMFPFDPGDSKQTTLFTSAHFVP